MNCYEVLEVDRQASQVEIEASYRRLLIKHKDDVVLFKRINDAGAILRDPDKRAKHDKELEIRSRVAMPRFSRTEVMEPGEAKPSPASIRPRIRSTKIISSEGRSAGLVRTEVVAAVAKEVACVACGTVNPGTDQYCLECGYLLGQEVLHTFLPAKGIVIEMNYEGQRQTWTFDADKEDIVIGRSRKCDIYLSDPEQYVSRQHAVMTLRDGHYFISDTSLNGTWVGGETLRKRVACELRGGERVEIEGRILTVRFA